MFDSKVMIKRTQTRVALWTVFDGARVITINLNVRTNPAFDWFFIDIELHVKGFLVRLQISDYSILSNV